MQADATPIDTYGYDLDDSAAFTRVGMHVIPIGRELVHQLLRHKQHIVAEAGEQLLPHLPVQNSRNAQLQVFHTPRDGCLAFLERVSRGTYPSFEATFAALVDLALRLTLSPDLAAARFRSHVTLHPACLLTLPLPLLP